MFLSSSCTKKISDFAACLICFLKLLTPLPTYTYISLYIKKITTELQQERELLQLLTQIKTGERKLGSEKCKPKLEDKYSKLKVNIVRIKACIFHLLVTYHIQQEPK